MDKDKLLELRDAAEQKSLALNERRTELQKEIDEVTTELVRLQGDYRTYEQILAEYHKPSAPVIIEDEDGPNTTE